MERNRLPALRRWFGSPGLRGRSGREAMQCEMRRGCLRVYRHGDDITAV
jgi:hypothetical protein